MSRLKIDIATPTAEDAILAGLRVSEAWLQLERAMVTGCRDGTGMGRYYSAQKLVEAMDVQHHVETRAYHMGECAAGCWVCKRAKEQADATD